MSPTRSALLRERDLSDAQVLPVPLEVDSESAATRRRETRRLAYSDTDRPYDPLWLCDCDCSYCCAADARMPPPLVGANYRLLVRGA